MISFAIELSTSYSIGPGWPGNERNTSVSGGPGSPGSPGRPGSPGCPCSPGRPCSPGCPGEGYLQSVIFEYIHTVMHIVF